MWKRTLCEKRKPSFPRKERILRRKRDPHPLRHASKRGRRIKNHPRQKKENLQPRPRRVENRWSMGRVSTNLSRERRKRDHHATCDNGSSSSQSRTRREEEVR